MPQQQAALFDLGEPAKPKVRSQGAFELNLIEFPLSPLSTRQNPNLHSVTFTDEIYDQSTGDHITRKLHLSSTPKYGLPTSVDELVIFSLIQISREQNFPDEIQFHYSNVLDILGWDRASHRYDRLRESILRWLHVTALYEDSWWLKEKKRFAKMERGFHFLEDYTGKLDGPLTSTASFKWGAPVIESLRAGYLGTMDLDLWRTLNSPTSKRLYLFLKKRFHRASHFRTQLLDFAHNKMGYSSNLKAPQIKQKLHPIFDELEAMGILRPTAPAERFEKVGKLWHVHFHAAQEPSLALPVQEDAPTLLEASFLAHSVDLKAAKVLIASHDEAYLKAKIQELEYRLTQANPPENPAGYLVNSIRESYKAPKGFVSPEEQQANEKAAQAHQEALKAKEKARQDGERRKEAAEEEQFRQSRRATAQALRAMSRELRLEHCRQARAHSNRGISRKLGSKAKRVIRQGYLIQSVLGQ